MQRGRVLWGGKGWTGGHGGAFVMGWDRPNLGSWPRTGKNSLYTPVNGIQFTFLLSVWSCVCLRERPQAVVTFRLPMNTRRTWEVEKTGPRPNQGVT